MDIGVEAVLHRALMMFATLRCENDTLLADQADSTHASLACNTCRSKKVHLPCQFLLDKVTYQLFVAQMYSRERGLSSMLIKEHRVRLPAGCSQENFEAESHYDEYI